MQARHDPSSVNYAHLEGLIAETRRRVATAIRRAQRPPTSAECGHRGPTRFPVLAASGSGRRPGRCGGCGTRAHPNRAYDEAVTATPDFIERELLVTRGWDPVYRKRPRH